jgi:anaphase-promoting complex subunit 7
MFTLYFKPSCAFSQRVLQMAENLNVTLDLKDVSESEEVMAELIEKGGDSQTPFLIDTETGVTLYESSDIVDYLREHKNGGSTPVAVSKPRVHVGGSVCVSCEG